MRSTNIYLLYNGNCEEAFNFYKSVFGGEFTYMGRFKDVPPYEGSKPVSKSDENRIMHVSLPVSKETVLMGSDTTADNEVKFGNNFSVSVNTDTKEDAEKIFKGLSDGGMVTMPMMDTFWGAYFGMFTDKFGVNWMVNCESAKK
jgi:PhnB protein